MNQPKEKQNVRVALITGAARRIGANIAKYLHQHGFRVIIHYHQSKTAAHAFVLQLNRQRSDSAIAICANLCDPNTIQPLINAAIAWGGQLDLLVNNASVFSQDDAGWEGIFTTNVQAPFWLSHAAYPHLKIQQGSIINITDTHADKPLKGYTIYCQSKAALCMQTQALAREFAPHVRVNAVAPGAIMWPEGKNTLTKEKQAQIIAKTLLQCHGDPSYIAQAVLAFSDNAFITGQTLRVDGGRS